MRCSNRLTEIEILLGEGKLPPSDLKETEREREKDFEVSLGRHAVDSLIVSQMPAAS